MGDQRFKVFFQLNETNPDIEEKKIYIRNLSAQKYLNIKHNNDYAIAFLQRWLQYRNINVVIRKLCKSIDDVEYELIYSE